MKTGGRRISRETVVVVVDDGGGIGYVVLHLSDVDFREGVTRSGVALDVDFHAVA